MKVMRIITRMNLGGPAVQISNLMNGLSSREFNQQLYFGSCEPGEQEFVSEIFDQSTLHRINRLKKSIGFLSEIMVFFVLIKEIRKFKPDIIHTHTAKAGFIGRIAAIVSRSRAKRIHTFHGHVLYGYFNKYRSVFYKLIERILAGFTDVIVSVGPEVQKDLLKFNIGKKMQHRVIMPGIKVGERIPKEKASKQLKLSRKKLTISFIGRFTAIKRIDRILELAKLCKEEKLDVIFLLVGDGPEFESIQTFVVTEGLPIEFFGWRNDVERILSASDVFLLTSDNEGTPISSIQASLLGVPTISTNVGSVRDIVINGETGLITSTEVSDLFIALKRIYSEQGLVEKLGRGAKDFANSNFSINRFLREYRDLYISMNSL